MDVVLLSMLKVLKGCVSMDKISVEYLDDLEIKTLTTNSFQSCWNLFYGVEGRETESCEHLIECFGLTSNDFIEQNCNVRGSFFGLEFQSSIFRNLFLLFLFQL